MGKPVLVSGIQPSGRLHIGNYLGALKNFVELQNSGKYECYFFIADLHSLTENFAPKEKSRQILELTADFLATGLDPKKSTMFLQSSIPAHAELGWIFNTITSMGELRRMTQFKDKSEVQQQNINAGLFTYPTLMAADILLYDPQFVPVGEDQLQHLELARALAKKFNTKFGRTFTEPQPILTKTPRIMSLTNPEKKMSKSQPEGCLFIDDSPEEIRKKIGRAVTDSGSEVKYDKAEKPGVSNLLEIYASLRKEPAQALEREFAKKTYSELKDGLVELVIRHFIDFRKKKMGLMKKSSRLKIVLKSGSERAGKKAGQKIEEVKRRVGILI